MDLTKSRTQYIDLPPAGWFPLDVMKAEKRKWDWVALMVDVHPDELKHCVCKTAFLYVHPRDYRPDGGRRAQEALGSCPWQASHQGCGLERLAGYARDTSLRGIAKARPELFTGNDAGHSQRQRFPWCDGDGGPPVRACGASVPRLIVGRRLA